MSRILAVHNSHNASVCEINKEEIIYFQEAERLDIKKRSSNWKILLHKYKDQTFDQFIFVHSSSDYPISKNTINDVLTQYNISCSKIIYEINHHFYHACSSFFNSGFKKSYVLILDGNGSYDHFDNNSCEIASLYFFNKNKYKKIFKVYGSDEEYVHDNNYFINTMSLGNVYTTVKKLLNFKEEGSVMALSCYGKEDMNIKLFTKKFNHFKSIQQDLYAAGMPFMKTSSTSLSRLIQKRLEEVVLNYVTNIINGKKRNLCVSGGVFQNTVLNSKILEVCPTLYVDPCADDSGISLGAALWFMNKEKFIKRKIKTLFLGDTPDYKYLNLNDGFNATYDDVAKLICEGNIVAIYQGRNELGKRALGNRSLLYDPRDTHAKEKINLLKNREWFRPTAGTVLYEHAHEWFDLKSKNESEFMSYVFKVKDKQIPGVTHVDNTCRIQTLRKEQNYHYYNLIYAFYKLTKVPILVNTSFNLAGKPLVNSVKDAMDTLNNINNYEFKFTYFPEIGKIFIKK